MPNFAGSLQAITGDDPVARLRGAVELLCAETKLVVAQVNAIDQAGRHVQLTNVGHDDDVAAYYRSPRFTLECMGFRTQRRCPDDLLSWDDIPGFESSYSADAVLRPSGFNNGMSTLIRDARGAIVAVCNANTVADHVPDGTKRVVAALRPTLARLATDVNRYLALGLTEREQEVLRLLATGRSNRQIADDLFISPRTVSTHVEHVFAKLGVSGRVEAATFATRVGLLAQD